MTIGQYSNKATAAGIFTSTTYTNSDLSHYLGVQPALIMDTLTNGHDADTPTGPSITAGEPITWTYIVTNTGDVTLTNIEVSDNNGTPLISGDDEDVCTIAALTPGSDESCQWPGKTAVEGQYVNIGTATAVISGITVIAYDTSHYLGRPDTQFIYLPMVIK